MTILEPGGLAALLAGGPAPSTDGECMRPSGVTKTVHATRPLASCTGCADTWAGANAAVAARAHTLETAHTTGARAIEVVVVYDPAWPDPDIPDLELDDTDDQDEDRQREGGGGITGRGANNDPRPRTSKSPRGYDGGASPTANGGLS